MEFITLTKDMVWKMLQREKKEKSFSETGAVISLLFDKLNDEQKGKREYSRIWGWSWDKLRYHWSKIDAISEVLATKSQHPSSTPPKTPKIDSYAPESPCSTPPKTPLTPHNYNITNNLNNNTYSKLLKNYNKSSKQTASPKKVAKVFSRDSWQYRFALAHLTALAKARSWTKCDREDRRKNSTNCRRHFR